MKVFVMAMRDPYEDVQYVAYGLDSGNMPMYRVTNEGLRRAGARFPAAMKFMELELEAEDPRLVEEEEVFAQYGEVVIEGG